MVRKHEVPGMLQQILKLDVKLTKSFCSFADNFFPLRSLRIHYKFLEISCHGIPWFCGLIALMWLLDNPKLYQMQVNLFVGLLIDVVIVAVVKALTRRRRPATSETDMLLTVGPDKFAFPSGHASRALFLSYYFIYLWPIPFLLILPLLAWAVCVCISRVLLRRHHLLDITAGAILGYMEGVLLGWIWLRKETCDWFVSWISDEITEGGSYHV